MTTAKSSWNDLNSSQVPFGSIMDVAGRKTRRCDHGGALATWTAVRVAASQQTVVGGVRAMKKASNWRFCGLYTVRNDQRTHPITKLTLGPCLLFDQRTLIFPSSLEAVA